MKIYIENHGCAANLNNAEIMAGILSKEHEIVDSEEKADLVILNTCTVKGPTERKMLRRMKDIKKRLIITGCMPDVQLKAIRGIRPDAILVSVKRIADIEQAIQGRDILEPTDQPKVNLPKISKNKIIEIIQISEGCLGDCSYCITKHAKGTLYSFPEEDIIRQIKNSDAKEIWLTSQDCGCYGLDKGTTLTNLLTKILDIKRDFKLRLGMMNPDHVNKELINIYKHPKMFKFIHIPIQAGDNDVLKHMNRKYTVEDFKNITDQFKKAIPDIHIMTDIICGYPTETAEQFQDSIKLIEQLEPDSLNISRFWPRSGTKAAELVQHEDKEIMRRSKEMHELFSKVAEKKNKRWIGWIGKVLIDEKPNLARNYCYKQFVLDSEEELGKEIVVKAIDAGMHYIKAKKVDG